MSNTQSNVDELLDEYRKGILLASRGLYSDDEKLSGSATSLIALASINLKNDIEKLITQAKKDLLAEVRELERYKWMCETLHGGYNADEKDVYAALKRYSEREDLRADFAAFFESAAIKEIEEGL